jgi:metal-responsive CopG/Arc/MetJ family transcriptional regulator
MRTLVDIDKADLRALDAVADRERRSRAAVIREAVSLYLEKKTASQMDDAFGLWGDRRTDGLEYQERVRSEW